MILRGVYSDQLVKWSDKGLRYDRVGKKIDERPEAQKDGAFEKTAAAGRRYPRLADRTIQTLRQVRLSLRARPRTRPEVLFVDHAPEVTTADGICPGKLPRASYGAVGELQTPAGYPGGNLCHQYRITSSQRKAVAAVANGCHHRHSHSRNSCSKHASALSALGRCGGGGAAE